MCLVLSRGPASDHVMASVDNRTLNVCADGGVFFVFFVSHGAGRQSSCGFLARLRYYSYDCRIEKASTGPVFIVGLLLLFWLRGRGAVCTAGRALCQLDEIRFWPFPETV
jgi:hypothetical protein